MILCIIDLLQFFLTNIFSVNGIFDCCLHQWWQDSSQVNRRNTTHFRRSDSSTESREAASHLQICGVCQVSGDFWFRTLTHSLSFLSFGWSSSCDPSSSSLSFCMFGSASLGPTLRHPVECPRKRVSLPPDDMTYPSLIGNKRGSFVSI